MIIQSFEQLDVYKMAFSIQQEIFELSRQFSNVKPSLKTQKTQWSFLF